MQEQFGGEKQPGTEGETWGVSEDESALREGEGEAAIALQSPIFGYL